MSAMGRSYSQRLVPKCDTITPAFSLIVALSTTARTWLADSSGVLGPEVCGAYAFRPAIISCRPAWPSGDVTAHAHIVSKSPNREKFGSGKLTVQLVEHPRVD